MPLPFESNTAHRRQTFRGASELLLGLVLLGGALINCSSNRTILEPPHTSSTRVQGRGLPPRMLPGMLPSLSVEQDLLLQEARSWLGTPYRWGGDDRRGIDCSAFVQNVLRTAGVEVPRTVQEIYTFGRTVRRSALQFGDLVFFRFKRRGGGPDHVGIYLGRGQFIHASVKGVRFEKLSTHAYDRSFYGSRRIWS